MSNNNGNTALSPAALLEALLTLVPETDLRALLNAPEATPAKATKATKATKVKCAANVFEVDGTEITERRCQRNARPDGFCTDKHANRNEAEARAKAEKAAGFVQFLRDRATGKTASVVPAQEGIPAHVVVKATKAKATKATKAKAVTTSTTSPTPLGIRGSGLLATRSASLLSKALGLPFAELKTLGREDVDSLLEGTGFAYEWVAAKDLPSTK